MIRAILSLYRPSFLTAIVYMLQSTEYQPKAYLAWFWRTNNFAGIMYRRTLERTKAARLLLLTLRLGVLVIVVISVGLLVLGYWQFGTALLLVCPVLLAHLVVLPLILGRIFIVVPRSRTLIQQSEQIFKNHTGEKLAIAGSYGKTSMKELLLTVLSAGDKKVVATPANKNVAISHAYFAKRLQGDEDVVIIEYGEGAPGDVAGFAATTHPTRALVTGIAPAHLDQYKTLDRAAEDIFAVADYVDAGKIYVNADSVDAKRYASEGQELYSAKGALGWKVSDVQIGIDGTHFTLAKGSKKLTLHSGLLGLHQVGPLSIAAALAHEFGLSDEQIIAGIAATKPYEHRMQPYLLAGAWVIDDTYNGNIEGIRAGTALLAALEAKRKVYVTPGLVDQGDETERVHIEMGGLIAAAKPDLVVLMQNTAAPYVQQGLEAAKYKGELQIVHDPLAFYTNLQLVVATGDVVMLQNDWTDNYH